MSFGDALPPGNRPRFLLERRVEPLDGGKLRFIEWACGGLYLESHAAAGQDVSLFMIPE